MFGHHYRSLDDKNRVPVPPKFREELGGVCYLTLGQDNVLELRSTTVFEAFKNRILSPNMLDRNARIFARLILGNTIEAEIDKVGRITLAPDYIKKLGIDREIVFVGIGDKAEIWSKKTFDEFQTNYDDKLDEIGNKLLESGTKL